jgi:hypothetical protein
MPETAVAQSERPRGSAQVVQPPAGTPSPALRALLIVLTGATGLVDAERQAFRSGTERPAVSRAGG